MSSEFLDQRQYTHDSIKDYESVWGEDFVSPGGREKARELIASLELAPGARVLDVGCGLGGSAFLMAEEFGLSVDGIDLSQNMVSRAQQRCRDRGLEQTVSIELRDCLKLASQDRYDAVYSRDAFLHVGPKARLFEALHRSLRSGGKLLFTDYCCASKPWSPSFSDYVASREYHLRTVDEYVALLSAAGFIEVSGRDLTDEFVATLESDLARISQMVDEVEMERAWQAKLQRARAGEQRWGLLSARKA